MSLRSRSSARILAIDLHPQRYGYAVLEGPAELLDWGVRRQYRNGVRRSDVSWSRKSLRLLLGQWRPTLLVVKRLPHSGCIRKIANAIVSEARDAGVRVQSVPITTIRTMFVTDAPITRHELAMKLADSFPVLAFTLPPKRKIYESEDYRIRMFTAIAVAVAATGPKPIPKH